MKISDLKFTGKLEIEGLDFVSVQCTNAPFDFVLDYIGKHFNCGEKPANELPSTEQNKNGNKRKKGGHKIVAKDPRGVIVSFPSKNKFLQAIGHKNKSTTLKTLVNWVTVNGWTIISANGKEVVKDTKPEVDENGQLNIPFNSEKQEKKYKRVSIKKDGGESMIFENVNSAADYFGVKKQAIYNRITKPNETERYRTFLEGDVTLYSIKWVQ